MSRASARARLRAAALVISTLSLATPAGAQDLCAPLTRLLTGAPDAFVAGHIALQGDQIWTAAPVVPRAVCELWEARQRDAETLRCTVNDHAAAAAVTAFYDSSVAVIDRCLAGLPASGPWKRATVPVADEGLKGTETTWLHDGDATRFKISLANFQRTVTNTFYDDFVVEYLKY